MSLSLANHNEDIKRLVDKGYAVSEDSNYLVVRDIPYLDSNNALKIGAIVSKFSSNDGKSAKMQDHQIFFCGDHPCEIDGSPIKNLGGGVTTLALKSVDLVVERSFSNKPPRGRYLDWFEKIENYVTLFSGPAMELYPEATPYTFREVTERSESVFKFRDTLTSRAEIGELSMKFEQEVVAIIGLGGTGSYVLDFLSRTPVKRIKGFDGDIYQVHNAYRSPGRLLPEELGQKKAKVYRDRYDGFRYGIEIESKYIFAESDEDMRDVTFAFVCVDKGWARAEIFDLLNRLSISFIDVGMGLNKSQGMIDGTLRTTYYGKDNIQSTMDKQLAPMQDHEDDIYKTNIQIGELNALNACFAVLRYKQLKGFYLDEDGFENMLFSIYDFHLAKG